MALNTKRKGNITELEIILAFQRLGYAVSLPYGDDEQYDFIADVGGRLIRVQAKTSHTDDEGKTFKFECRNMRYNSKGGWHIYYDADDFDYFGTSWKGQCYLIPISECWNSKRLRIAPKRDQRGKTAWAEDYELEKVAHKLEEEELNERIYQDRQTDTGLGVVGRRQDP